MLRRAATFVVIALVSAVFGLAAAVSRECVVNGAASQPTARAWLAQ